ncbi:MAG: 50S ribosomal protein L9 [Coriobacteriia bacterium]|jgi:large subunit ribosomal protein L9|nr:50S ribosomal protein L9 [Coriobacteriia bacterium]
MKVILTQELKGRGGEGDVVDVAHGYAVNYLLPRKLAIEATPGNLKQLEARKGNILKREEARVADASSLAERLEGGRVTIEAKAGEEGRLFGSITSPMIVDAIASQLETEVDRRKIDVHGHIKTLGEHVVSVQVYRDIRTEVTVVVVPEGGATAPAQPTVEEAIAAVEAEEDAEALEANAPEISEEQAEPEAEAQSPESAE